MCGSGITNPAIAAQLRFNQEFCGQARSALVTFTAISGAISPADAGRRFHGNVRMGHNRNGPRRARALVSGDLFLT
jgi:hypothetical protein